MEAADPFETSVSFHQSTRRHIQEERKLTLTDVRTPDITRPGLHNSDWRTFPPGSSDESDNALLVEGFHRDCSRLLFYVNTMYSFLQ